MLRDGEAEFEKAVQNALKDDWRPFVRVWSKRDGERTSIYAREHGNNVSLFIVTIEQTEAVVMEVKMSAKRFARMADDPENVSGPLRETSHENRRPKSSDEAAAKPPALRHRDDATAGNP